MGREGILGCRGDGDVEGKGAWQMAFFIYQENGRLLPIDLRESDVSLRSLYFTLR